MSYDLEQLHKGNTRIARANGLEQWGGRDNCSASPAGERDVAFTKDKDIHGLESQAGGGWNKQDCGASMQCSSREECHTTLLDMGITAPLDIK